MGNPTSARSAHKIHQMITYMPYGTVYQLSTSGNKLLRKYLLFSIIPSYSLLNSAYLLIYLQSASTKENITVLRALTIAKKTILTQNGNQRITLSHIGKT